MALYKHRMEEKVLEKEESIRALLNATSDALFLLDKDVKFLALNEAMARRLKKPVDEVLGTPIIQYLSDKLYPPRLMHFDLILQKERASRFEEEFEGKWYDNYVAPIFDSDGTVKKLAVFSRDITRRKKDEEQLRVNDEYLRSIIENAADLTIVLKSGGNLSGVSTTFERITGYSFLESIGTPIWDFIYPDDLEKAKVVMNELLAAPKSVKPLTVRLKSKGREPVIIEGLLCNLLDNPVIEGIVFNGWERARQRDNT